MDNNNNNNNKNINWFPGHMQKSVKEIASKIKDVDFIIEVVDARAPFSSSNEELNKLFINKIKIVIALKSDLSDFNQAYNDKNGIFFTSIYSKNMLNSIVNEIKKKCQQKIDQKIKRGFVNVKLFGMVVGLPNVGKSSLINFLKNKKIAIVQNTPGTTRKLSWNKINNDIYILDSPGIFFKKINDIEVGYKLAMIDCINRNIVNKKDILNFAFEFYWKHYSNDFKKLFNFTVSKDFNIFIENLCKNNFFLLKNKEPDYERAYTFLFSLFDSKKMFKLNYDK